MSLQPAPKLRTVHCEPSWRLANDCVELFVTRSGGHVGPVTFDRRGRKLRPYSIAPWADEPTVRSDHSLPTILRVLRGDLFCLPFGGNTTPYRGERHPVHGETANADWRCEGIERSRADGLTALHLSLDTRIRPGRVEKTIALRDGHDAVYSRHVIRSMRGPINLGHHAMLRFPDEPGAGRISTSRFIHGQVFVEPIEQPENRGYSTLLPGATFDRLEDVPTITGQRTDLSRYPARRGFEDIVMLSADPTLPFAWTAVTFPGHGWAWLAVKDPRVLASTVFWISNGGRHYAPWNGRHVNVMGLEEVTSWFHPGLAESVAPNDVSRAGIPTHLRLDPRRQLAVNYITAAFPVPRGFDRVADVVPEMSGGVRVVANSGRSTRIPLDLSWLTGGGDTTVPLR